MLQAIRTRLTPQVCSGAALRLLVPPCCGRRWAVANSTTLSISRQALCGLLHIAFHAAFHKRMTSAVQERASQL